MQRDTQIAPWACCGKRVSAYRKCALTLKGRGWFHEVFLQSLELLLVFAGLPNLYGCMEELRIGTYRTDDDLKNFRIK